MNSQWGGGGRPWQSFPQWLLSERRHRTAGREWGCQRFNKYLSGWRGPVQELKPPWRYSPKLLQQGKGVFGRPAQPHTFSFLTFSVRLYQEGILWTFGAPWRKDNFKKKFTISIESMYGQMVSENNIREGFQITENLLLSWGAGRREWSEWPCDYLSASVVPIPAVSLLPN